MPSKNHFICGKHFFSGRPSTNSSNVDCVPSIFTDHCYCAYCEVSLDVDESKFLFHQKTSRCKKNKIEKLLESEKIITDSAQKVTMPSSYCDEENDQKYNSEEKEKENLHKQKNARKEKLVARKEFEMKTIDLGKKRS